jgi:glycosyltransferase involved in cell wall biosynthesis
MTPELSVVVVVGPRRARAASCLRSLLADGLGDRLELIVVDVEPAGAAPLAGADDPRVRVLRLPPATTFATARVAGVGAARGAVVAFLEEHCRVLPGWGEALLRAYASGPWSGVGTRIENANPGRGTSDITGLLAYHYFYPPLASGEVEFLPGHNASFRRDVLLAYADRLERLLRSDIVFHRRLRADRHRLYVAADAAIAHLNEVSAASRGRGIASWYRLFANERAREFRWPRARRWAYALACPALPLYYAWTAWRAVRAHRPQYLPILRLHAGTVAVSGLAAAWGMATGLLLGNGDAELRFSRFEVEEWRGEDEEPPARAA